MTDITYIDDSNQLLYTSKESRPMIDKYENVFPQRYFYIITPYNLSNLYI